MRGRLTFSLCAALALAGCATAARGLADAYLEGFRAAETQGRPFAPITDTAPALTIAEAYRLQDRLVAARIAHGDQVAGVKGGLMSAASLAGKHVKEPLTAVLFASGRRRSGEDIRLCGYRRAAFEMKLGFRIGRAITRPLDDIAALEAHVDAVEPVVDLPDIAYRDPDHYGAVDMVAANVSSALFVEGAPRDPAGLDLDGLRVTFSRDGQRITEGQGRESLGGQWASLLTLANLVIARGGRLEPGQVVITGKLGDKGWLPPGAYRADFGPLGVVAFKATACR
jgi:2-oxo-3-hexenedioate decarboxylase